MEKSWQDTWRVFFTLRIFVTVAGRELSVSDLFAWLVSAEGVFSAYMVTGRGWWSEGYEGMDPHNAELLYDLY